MGLQINKIFACTKNYKLKKILYITYDSLSDSISKSQILPLLNNLIKNYNLYLVSFEKKFQKKNEIENATL